MAEEKIKPEHKIRVGNVTATIWKNEHKKDKEEFTTYSITIERNYMKGDEWKTTNSYKTNDLLKVITACQEAYKKIMLKDN